MAGNHRIDISQSAQTTHSNQPLSADCSKAHNNEQPTEDITALIEQLKGFSLSNICRQRSENGPRSSAPPVQKRSSQNQPGGSRKKSKAISGNPINLPIPNDPSDEDEEEDDDDNNDDDNNNDDDDDDDENEDEDEKLSDVDISDEDFDSIEDQDLLKRIRYWEGPNNPERNPKHLDRPVRKALVRLLKKWDQEERPGSEGQWDAPSKKLWPCISHSRIGEHRSAKRQPNGYACVDCQVEQQFCIRARTFNQIPLLVPLPKHHRLNNVAYNEMAYWVKNGQLRVIIEGKSGPCGICTRI